MNISTLDLDLSTLGTVQKIITCTVEGILEHEDILRMSTPAAVAERAPAHTQPGELQRVRERHHTVARMVASGMPQNIVATCCSYTESYLSTLLRSPSMQELVAYYRANAINATEVVTERLRHAGYTALETLIEKAETDELDNQELLSLAKLGLDRSGHGPQSKVAHTAEQHIFDHAELQKLNREARAASRSHIIDVTPQLPDHTNEPGE